MEDEISQDRREELQLFVADSLDLFDDLDQKILNLEHSLVPEETQTTIDAAFRCFHSLKGAAGFLELKTIQGFTHKVEDTLQKIRENPSIMNSDHVDVFLSCCDLLRKILIKVENDFHDTGFEEEVNTIVQMLEHSIRDSVIAPQTDASQKNDGVALSSPKKQDVASIPENISPNFEPTSVSFKKSTQIPSNPKPANQSFPSTILYIDDDENLQGIVKDYFKAEYQLELLQATDEITGFRLANEKHPDFILLDLVMPTYGKEAGFEVLKQLKEVPVLSNIPVIMLTAEPGHELALKALELGAEDFERKPIDLEKLAEKISFCYSHLIQHNKKQGENNTLITNLTNQLRDSKIQYLKFIRRNFFLEIMMNFFNDSLKCQNPIDLLEFLIEATKLLGWRCTATLTHQGEVTFRSDYQDNEIGGFIIRGLKKSEEKFIMEPTFAMFMSEKNEFALLIRNIQEIQHMPDDTISTKPKAGEIRKCGEELVKAFMARYDLFK